MVIIESEETIYLEKFNQGFELIQECRQSFSVEKLAKAVELIIVAFNNGIKQEQIFSMLSHMLYAPNVVALRKNYESNCDKISAVVRRLRLPNFTALPFQIYPVSEKEYYLFDYQNKIFLDKYKVNLLWWSLAELALKTDFNARETFIVELLQNEYNNARARRMFAEIKERLDKKAFDVSLHKQISLYGEIRPDCNDYEWLMGKYYANKRDYKSAEKWARQGWLKYKFNFSLTLLLAEMCVKQGKLAEGAGLYVLLKYALPLQQSFAAPIQKILQQAAALAPPEQGKVLRHMALNDTNILLAPLLNTFAMADDYTVSAGKVRLCCGEFLEKTENSDDFFVGVHNSDQNLSSAAYEIEQWDSSDDLHKSMVMKNFRFDFLKGNLVNEYINQATELPYLLPVLLTQEGQELNVEYDSKANTLRSGRYENNFIRIQEDIHITSSEAFLCGKPIVLQHNPQRRKLVLNILLDSLTGARLQGGDFADTPNLQRFFASGTIFSNAFVAAECKYASLGTIETGCYQHKTSLFYPETYTKLADTIIPISQQLQRQGYYCSNLAGVSASIYNGICRGYDRVIMDFTGSRISEVVDRTLRHLAAFSETDNFITLYCPDVNLPQEKSQVDLAAQTAMSLDERFACPMAAAQTDLSPVAMRQYREIVQNTDRYLGLLFDYIESNYGGDEILITVLSERGNSPVSQEPYIFSEKNAQSPLMLRGCGVPEQLVCDELVSAMDLYSMLGYLLGYEVDETQIDSCLPKIFGGSGREYVISQAISPHQPYIASIRTMQHEFRVQSKDKINYDGHVNLDFFSWELYERDENPIKIADKALMEKFFAIIYRHTKGMCTFLTAENL